MTKRRLPVMLQTTTIDKRSPFLGEECALCKDPFAPGEEIVICPEDGSRHHVHCWAANGNKCAAYGCSGQGIIEAEAEEETSPPHRPSSSSSQRSSPRPTVITRPSSSFGCGQTCLLIAIALSIIFFSIGCFGLWAIFDYLMLNVWDMPYRMPFSGMVLPFLFTLN